MIIYYLEANGRFDFYRLNRNRRIVPIGSCDAEKIYISDAGCFLIGNIKEKIVGIYEKKGIKINLDDLFVTNLKFGIKE